MTTKWGQRWTGATFGPGGTKFGGALRAEKRKEWGWAKKHQGKVREVSKYVQVFSPIFIFFSFLYKKIKDSRLEDLWIVSVWFARQGRSWATEDGCKRHLWGAAGSYQDLLNQKLLASWKVFTLLHWHSEFTTRFYIKLLFTKFSKSQGSWILTYLHLKCCTLSPCAGVGDRSKTQCIHKALSFCLQT